MNAEIQHVPHEFPVGRLILCIGSDLHSHHSTPQRRVRRANIHIGNIGGSVVGFDIVGRYGDASIAEEILEFCSLLMRRTEGMLMNTHPRYELY